MYQIVLLLSLYLSMFGTFKYKSCKQPLVQFRQTNINADVLDSLIVSSVAAVNILAESLKTPKDKLLQDLDGPSDSLLVCPETLYDLQLENRYYGLVQDTNLIEPVNNNKYTVIPNQYIDLTIPETNVPFFSRSINKIVGEGFFQNPLISTAYERGYRDNFKSMSKYNVEM